MGKYVDAAQRRSRHTMPRLMKSNDAGVQGACPFTGAIHSDDTACVLDSLTADPRVSTELAVNLVMALFRTGIDSVCSISHYFTFVFLAERSVRDYVLYVFFFKFQKHDFLRFFEMTYQKVVKSHKKYQVC